MLDRNLQHAQALSVSRFIDRLTPGRALASGMLFWVVLFITAPVEPRFSDIWTGYVLIFVSYVGFFSGFIVTMGMNIEMERTIYNEKTLEKFIVLLAIIGFMGLGFKLYDVFVVRGVSIGDDVIAARAVSGRTESSLISVLAAACLPFSSAALLVNWYSRFIGYKSRMGFWLLVAAILPNTVPLIFGSRSTLLLFAMLVLAAVLNLTRKILWRHIFIAALAVFIMAVTFAAIFLNRVEASGMNILLAARISAYTQVVPLQPWALSVIDNSGDFGPVLASYTSLIQYCLSGMFEFLYLVELKDDNFAWGGYTFFFLPKLISVFSGAGSVTDAANSLVSFNPRTGIFQTFLGTIYVDFGLLTPVFCLLFGMLASWLRLLVRAGNVFAFPLYTLILSQLLLAPCIDSLSANAVILANMMFGIILMLGSGFGYVDRSRC